MLAGALAAALALPSAAVAAGRDLNLPTTVCGKTQKLGFLGWVL